MRYAHRFVEAEESKLPGYLTKRGTDDRFWHISIQSKPDFRLQMESGDLWSDMLKHVQNSRFERMNFFIIFYMIFSWQTIDYDSQISTVPNSILFLLVTFPTSNSSTWSRYLMNSSGVCPQTFWWCKSSRTPGAFEALFSCVMPLVSCQCLLATKFLRAEAALELDSFPGFIMDFFMSP